MSHPFSAGTARWLAFCMGVALFALAAGCAVESDSPPSSAAESGVERADGVAHVHLTGNDEMKYNLKEFTVRTGEKVRLTFVNTGRMPVTVMGHNVVILKGGDVTRFVSKVGTHGGNPGNGFLPATLLDQVVAHTKMLDAGETTVIEFTAPAPGEYPYLCTFPGHFVTMRGRMIVDGQEESQVLRGGTGQPPAGRS